MTLSLIKKFLILGSGILLLGTASCKKAQEQPLPEAGASVVPYARVSMTAGQDATKASYASRLLSWEVGDQLLLFSNSQVNGTLTCTSVDGSGKGTFSGEVVNLDITGANVFFLGNRSVAADATSITVDFSSQTGSATRLPSYIFLEKLDVAFSEVSADVYAPAAPITLEGVNSVLELKMDYTGTPGEGGAYKANRVEILGLKNKLTLNFADGTWSAGYVSAEKLTTVVPTRVGDYADSYYMSVLPDAGHTDLRVIARYQDSGVGSSSVIWTGVDWSAMASGTYYWTNWYGKTIVQASTKGGYAGQAVTGGENADGTNHKGGYNGSNADGSVDDPISQKGGYAGNDVL